MVDTQMIRVGVCELNGRNIHNMANVVDDDNVTHNKVENQNMKLRHIVVGHECVCEC